MLVELYNLVHQINVVELLQYAKPYHVSILADHLDYLQNNSTKQFLYTTIFKNIYKLRITKKY